MTVVTELHFKTRTLQRDWQGQHVGRLVWFIDIADAGTALNYAKVNNAIDVNMPFPGVPTLFADVIDYARDPSGAGGEITATFSSDRRFGSFQKIDKDKPGYYSFDVDIKPVVIKTPANIRSVITKGGVTAESIPVWVIEERSIDEPRSLITVNVVVADWDKNKTTACMAQVNKIHTIGGLKYLYRGAKTFQRRQSGGTSGGSWDVTHEWLGDPGTAPIESPNPAAFRIGAPAGRLPHWAYIVEPSDDPAADPHTITTYRPHEEAPNGWIGLPGMPPL